MAKIEFELVKSAERLGHIANEILDSPVTGLDIETTGFKPDQKDSKPSPFRDDIRLMSINTGKGVYVIDHYETKTLEPVVRALEETKGIKLASNAKYEQSWLLSQYNAELWPLFDPFRASALLTNGKKLPNDLYSMYERYLKIAPPTKDLGASDWSLPLTPEQYEYSASDVTYLHQLRDVLKPQLAKQGLNRVALIEFGAILPESAVELNGFPIDSEAWLALAAENQAKAEELHKKLVWNLPNPKAQQTLFGFEPDLNLNSPPQMLASLRKLGIKQQCEECRGKGVTRYREACGICQGTGIVELQNTREMTIAMFAAEFPIVKELIEYRGYDKSVSTYGPEWLRWIDITTGRLHSSFWPFTEAGRYSSAKPNIQNLPRDKRFRRCFKAPKGKRFRLGDYKNIEMVIIAELSKDPRLMEVFRNGEDAHYITASALMERAIALITEEERQQAKPVNFGFSFGMQPPKMVQYAMANYGVAISLKQSTEFRSKFFQLYSRLEAWHKEKLEIGPRNGFARTKGGRIRYLTEDAHNEYLNSDVQGTAADGLKAALREVYMRLKKFGAWNGPVKMIHHIHDEIITEIDDDPELDREVDKELKAGMHDGMAQFIQSVPVVVETKSGPSWGAK